MNCFERRNRPGDLLNAADEGLTNADLTTCGWRRGIRVSKTSNRIAANAIMPYPPGENFWGADSPQIGYLRGMQNREQQFPGFAGVIEGSELHDGSYHVLCVK
jgi:arginine decarboxylase